MGNTIKTILQVLNNKALGGTITNNSDSIILADNNNYIQDFKGNKYGLPTVRYDNGGHLFGNGGTELDWSPESWFSLRTRKPDGTLFNKEEAERLASHIPEYLDIERTAKANGTWLKMPNGSTWEGDPRSWVMMQSEAFKKNYDSQPWYTGQAEWPAQYDYGQGTVSTNKVIRAPYYDNQMWFSDSKDYGDTFANYQNSTGLNWRFDTPGEEDVKGKNFLAAIPREGNYRILEADKDTPDYWRSMPYRLNNGMIERLPNTEIKYNKNRNALIRTDGQQVLTDDVVNWSKDLGDQGIFLNNVEDGAVIINDEIRHQPVNEFISQPGFTKKVKFIEGNTGDFDIKNPYKYAYNNIVSENNYTAYGGPIVHVANMFDDGGTTTGPEVVITPDEEYNRFLNTLPDNQRLTPNGDYDTYLYWKLNGKPKNFQEALGKDMYSWDDSDKSYHGNSIAWGDDDTGYFIKPKHHDTLKYELDWFNKNIVTEEGGHQRFETPEERAESDKFRENYVLADDPNRPDFYVYKLKDQAEGLNTYKRWNDLSIKEKALGEHLFSLGGDDDSYRIGRYAYDIHDVPGTTLPEVTVNGYAPIILDTYFPVASQEYPVTGHSMLAVPRNNLYSSNRTDSQISKLPQQVQENLNHFTGYDFIDKSNDSPTYNLLTNNCADATLGALNAIFGTNESPFLFTTPGDVMDYSKKMAEKFGGRSYTPEYGMVRTIIPRNKDNYKSTARNFYKYAQNHETDGFEQGGYRRYYEENPFVQEYNWDKLIHGYY